MAKKATAPYTGIDPSILDMATMPALLPAPILAINDLVATAAAAEIEAQGHAVSVTGIRFSTAKIVVNYLKSHRDRHGNSSMRAIKNDASKLSQIVGSAIVEIEALNADTARYIKSLARYRSASQCLKLELDALNGAAPRKGAPENTHTYKACIDLILLWSDLSRTTFIFNLETAAGKGELNRFVHDGPRFIQVTMQALDANISLSELTYCLKKAISFSERRRSDKERKKPD